jgi:hypothetical protein
MKLYSLHRAQLVHLDGTSTAFKDLGGGLADLLWAGPQPYIDLQFCQLLLEQLSPEVLHAVCASAVSKEPRPHPHKGLPQRRDGIQANACGCIQQASGKWIDVLRMVDEHVLPALPQPHEIPLQTCTCTPTCHMNVCNCSLH